MTRYVGSILKPLDWQVTADGKPLNPRFDLRNHSPTGFAWGYSGSGPAQLSLALIADATKDDTAAILHYQKFKSRVIASLDKDKGWVMSEDFIIAWVKDQMKSA